MPVTRNVVPPVPSTVYSPSWQPQSMNKSHHKSLHPDSTHGQLESKPKDPGQLALGKEHWPASSTNAQEGLSRRASWWDIFPEASTLNYVDGNWFVAVIWERFLVYSGG